MMFYRRRIDTSAYLIVWQIGVAGDQSLARFSTGAAHRQVLVDVLARDYPLDHEVVIYEAPTLPMHRARVERLTLRELVDAEVHMHSTLVVPPATTLQADDRTRQRLTALDLSTVENT
jgi:hypothetical protein